jgi:RNA polymerase sigma factor (sigma-70 family)
VLPYAEVDDVVQEAFLEAYLNLNKLRQPDRFRAWVCGIGLNLARMRLRQLSWLVDLETATSLPSPHPSPEHLAEQHESAQRLYTAISDLPPSEREALLLVYHDGFTHQETAVQLGISLTAVKVRVHRGRNRLRAALAPKERQMVEVIIHDVLTDKVGLADLPTVEEMGKTGKEALWQSTNSHYIIILKEKDKERYLPIWVGPFEAQLVVFKLKEKEITRPILFDLTRILMDLGELALSRVVVSRLHEEIFYGSLIIGKNGATHEVDCRPSDAINLAVRQGVPIFAAAEVMEQSAVMAEDGQPYCFKNEREPEVDWYSLLTEKSSELEK